MTAYASDQEQIEMLKKWWQDYGKAIAIAIVVGVMIGFGWRYFRQLQLEKTETVSSTYQQIVYADTTGDVAGAQQLTKQLMDHHPKLAYSSLAAMIWAREAADKNQLDVALEKLQWVIAHAQMKNFKQIARLQAARILLTQNKSKAALDLLATIDDPSFQALIQNAKGDIYFAMGDGVAAKKAYQKAQLGISAVMRQNDPFLDMKLAQVFPEKKNNPAVKTVTHAK